jgi:hypothetical protein
MQEIINCPSCQRKLQVPEALLGQDVQCPTCGATFTATLGGQVLPQPGSGPAPGEPSYDVEQEPGPRGEAAPRRRDGADDYDDYDDEADRRRLRRRRDLLPHRGSTVLTLGVLALVIPCLSIILGPIAWIMGNQDLMEIHAGRMDPEGESSTNAGRICGIIATVLGILAFLFLCLILVAIGMEAGQGGAVGP